MCIRDRRMSIWASPIVNGDEFRAYTGLLTVDALLNGQPRICLLYTSDAADDLLCVDLGGRRIIQKKNTQM